MTTKGYMVLLFFITALKLPFSYAQHKNVFTLTQSPFKQAEKYFKQADYRSAIVQYQKALLNDRKKQGQIKLRLANSYRLLHQTKEAEQWYKDIMNNKALVDSQDVLNYAMVLLSNKKYEACKAWLAHYSKEYGIDSLVLRKIQGIDQLSFYYEDSLTRPVRPLSINTSDDEFSPVFYDKGIIFTSSREGPRMVKLNNAKDHQAFLDLYYSAYNPDSTLSEPKPWHPDIRGDFHEGPIVFYHHDSSAIFTKNFSARKRHTRKHTQHLGLFAIEKKEGNQWSEPLALPFNDPTYSIAHAAMSTDGKQLYFTSNKPGGYGGTDIYTTRFNGSSWEVPVNLGLPINTAGDESFPYLFQDHTLYFSSTGHAGLGGLDMYRAHSCATGFCAVENLGYPINSSQDDFGIVFAANQHTGYFSSNRKRGGEDDDLFSFEITTVYLKGTVKTRLKSLPMLDATVQVSLEGKVVLATQTNAQGQFLLALDPSKAYDLAVWKENYKIHSSKISTRHRSPSDTITQEIKMERELKTLVKAIVSQNDSTVTEHQIMALETCSLQQDTILSDDKGEFFFEADPELEYYFYVDNGRYFGDVLLEPSKKTKGTFLLYTKIELHTYDTSFVNVVVRDKNEPVPNAVVVLKNTTTQHVDSLFTDTKGVIRFLAKSYAYYTVSSSYKSKGATFPDFNLLTNGDRNIILYLKRER
jgi:tetratricopeptide (TPR) repeat protein